MMQGAVQLMPYSPSSFVQRNSLPPLAFQNGPSGNPGRRNSLPPPAFLLGPPSSPGQPFQNRPPSSMMSPMSGPSTSPMPAQISSPGFSSSFSESMVIPAGMRSGFSQSFSGRPNSGTTATSPAPQTPALLKGRGQSFSQSFSGRPNSGTTATSPVPQAPALLKARSSTPPMLPASPQSSDASPPPTHPQQANKMKMQRSAPLAQVASKTTRDFDIIGYPPEKEPESIQKAASRARAQRSAPAPPPGSGSSGAPPPPIAPGDRYSSSADEQGDATWTRGESLAHLPRQPALLATEQEDQFPLDNIDGKVLADAECARSTGAVTRVQRSAPKAAPYALSSSVSGDASVDPSLSMSSFMHTDASSSARPEVDYALYNVDHFNATQTTPPGTKHSRGGGPNFVLDSVLEEFPVTKPSAFQASMPEPKSNFVIGAYSHWPGEEDRPVITWEDGDAYGKSAPITVWVLDMVGRKHPVHTTTDDNVLGLRQKIMKMPWIKAAEAAWTIHGGKEIILKRKVLNKYTGKYEMLTLENGDDFEHIPTKSSIGHGTVIEPEYDDAAYGMSALSLDVRGLFSTVLRGTGVESL